MRQLLAWMQAPVPADAITPDTAPQLLGCGAAGGAGPAPRMPGSRVSTRLVPGTEAAAPAAAAAAGPEAGDDGDAQQQEEGRGDALAALAAQIRGSR